MAEYFRCVTVGWNWAIFDDFMATDASGFTEAAVPESAEPTEGSLFRSTQPSATSGGWRRGRWRVRLGDAVGRRLARS